MANQSGAEVAGKEFGRNSFFSLSFDGIFLMGFWGLLWLCGWLCESCAGQMVGLDAVGHVVGLEA